MAGFIFFGVLFIKIDNIVRHPTQIYEAILEGLVIFIILNYLVKKNFLDKPGIISSYFLILYSIFRFLLEFLREPDFHLGYLFLQMTMGQILSVFLFIFGVFLLKQKNEK